MSRVTVAAVLFVLITAGGSRGQEPSPVAIVAGDPMYQVLPPGAIPAITDPSYLQGAGAEAQMHPDEPVMGVIIEGRARAYSLWQLDAHEIVNDTLAGIHFAVTW